MQCNIDARGKRVRFIGGVFLTTFGLAVLTAAFTSDFRWLWIVGAAIVLMGGFMIFEARAGWCVVRAMGFKTKI